MYKTHLPFWHIHTEWSSKKSMQNTFNVEASSKGKLKVLHAVLSINYFSQRDTGVVMNVPATMYKLKVLH